MERKARLTLTRVYTAKIDEAYASGNQDKLLTALYPLAQHMTKHDMLATQFLMQHISTRLHRYQGLKYRGYKEALFSSWVFIVFKYRFRDWIRKRQAQRKREAVIVKPFYREGDTSGENPDDETVTAEEKLGWLYEGKIPALEKKFGKRELQKLRATKAIQMRQEGKGNVEIAAFLSKGKRAVKPSSVPATLSRWNREREKILEESSYH